MVSKHTEKLKLGVYIKCHNCSGYGLVSSDFEPNWPKECLFCNETGNLYLYESGTIVTHPHGGKFRGKLSKNDK